MGFLNEFYEGMKQFYHLTGSKMILHTLLVKFLHFQIAIQFLKISYAPSMKKIATVLYYFLKTV